MSPPVPQRKKTKVVSPEYVKSSGDEEPNSEGESEVDERDEVVDIKGKRSKKKKESEPMAKYDPSKHTAYADRCVNCLHLDPEVPCYFITDALDTTTNWYKARKAGKTWVGRSRPIAHACVYCTHHRKAGCISPPNRLLVGADFALADMYDPSKPTKNSEFLRTFLGRDANGDLVPDCVFTRHELDALIARVTSTSPPAPVATKGTVVRVKNEPNDRKTKGKAKANAVPVIKAKTKAIAGTQSHLVSASEGGSQDSITSFREDILSTVASELARSKIETDQRMEAFMEVMKHQNRMVVDLLTPKPPRPQFVEGSSGQAMEVDRARKGTKKSKRRVVEDSE